MKEYEIKPENTYNMDEKGVLIGFLTKAKRIVAKAVYEKKGILGNTQDGSREWITIIGCICGDGTWLPPGLIYQAKTGNIQDTWVQDMDPQSHNIFIASSEKGWTDNKLGFAWLSQIFDRFTKAKCRRDWRLLFVDGHGSHINMAFLEWCEQHRILVAVYPPHSTHRLQPLDVSLFSPFATYYAQELDRFIHNCQGLSSITKRDFLRLFWPAWTKAFSVSNIASGWRKTGLLPFDPLQVLQIFESQAVESRPSTSGSASSILSAKDWRKIEAMLERVVKDQLTDMEQKEVRKLSNTITAITTENAILKIENKGFREALNLEKKKRKRGKGLFEELRALDNNGATFFSPKKIDQARALQAQKEEAKVNEIVTKQLEKESAKALTQKRQLEAQRAKEMKQQKKEEKAAQRATQAAAKLRDKEVKEAGKQLQASLQSIAKTPKKSKKLVVVLPVAVVIDNEVVKPRSRIQGNSRPQRTARQQHKLQL